MKAGLNLYSLRSFIKTEESFLSTANRLKEMGYGYLQYSGAPLDAEMIKSVSEKSGMPVVLTHSPMDRIINDTAALMEEHAKFGCKNIGLGMMPLKVIIDEKECKETVEKLNAAGKIMSENGFKFFYHHHHYEFLKHNGETVFDYIIKNAPYINFIVDTYWLQFGGVNILDTLEKLGGRAGCVHLKDYQLLYKETEKNILPCYAPVGDGNIDFQKVVAKMREIGVEHYLVEQDDAISYPDPFEQVERSIRYIKTAL